MDLHDHVIPWEYLVFGPVMGDCFFSVPRASVSELWSGPGSGLLSVTPDKHGQVSRERFAAQAAACRQIAQMLRAPAWLADGEGADVVIYTTAVMLSAMRFAGEGDTLRRLGAGVTHSWDATEIKVIIETL
jgi:hypothetical protein